MLHSNGLVLCSLMEPHTVHCVLLWHPVQQAWLVHAALPSIPSLPYIRPAHLNLLILHQFTCPRLQLVRHVLAFPNTLAVISTSSRTDTPRPSWTAPGQRCPIEPGRTTWLLIEVL